MERPKRRAQDKQFYINQAKRQKLAKYRLVSGIRGFLLFCNSYEREAIREAYRLLNQFADQAEAPPETDLTEAPAADDVDAALAQERQALAQEHRAGTEAKRFQVVESGVTNVLFIRTTWARPVDLVVSILRDIAATRMARSRYLLRLLPVEATCAATVAALEQAAEPVLARWLADQTDVTFAVQFKARLNHSLSREDVTRMLATRVKALNLTARVEFKRPKYTIMVEVMKGLACLAVLPDYAQFKKYNLIELAQKPAADPVPTPASPADPALTVETGGEAPAPRQSSVSPPGSMALGSNLTEPTRVKATVTPAEVGTVTSDQSQSAPIVALAPPPPAETVDQSPTAEPPQPVEVPAWATPQPLETVSSAAPTQSVETVPTPPPK